ncbi:hypothetical protein KNV19_gp69 [Gordonia phage Portcullis]|uniref:Uncharacterized protein n=1 Tax=Gordonia phage Portcullis TaxID=2762414 RepID=A0A7G8LGL1_9CAUD|nr:hypothetical protein KNV19_gp69 [Gordonia phage Portcullis]QNJ56383.1 hypothetical protein SEA_PORTCULLIS_69 [Gordonia phage Portcullis]
MSDFLDMARDQILEQHPDMQLDRPGFAVVLYPGPPCTCGCGGNAIEAAVAAHPEAFPDMADAVRTLRAIADHLQQEIGEANYQMSEIRRRHQQ